VQFNTDQANDFSFLLRLNAIGIKESKPFAPHARMKTIMPHRLTAAHNQSRALSLNASDKREQVCKVAGQG
jgi:hypothetical protein